MIGGIKLTWQAKRIQSIIMDNLKQLRPCFSVFIASFYFPNFFSNPMILMLTLPALIPEKERKLT